MGNSPSGYARVLQDEGRSPAPEAASAPASTSLSGASSLNSGEEKKPSTMRMGWRTMKIIAPYYWPGSGVNELRVRVVLTLLIIVAGKVLGLFVPKMYQEVVNSANEGEIAGGAIFVYGLLRLLTGSARDLRETIFLKVQNAVARTVALDAFWHLSNLSLNFHLTRNTGALMRTMDRGKAAVGTMLSMVGFSIAPLLLELIMTCAVLVPYGWSYSMITLVTISGYVAFTLAVTEWRTKFRRGMNDMDNETSNKALDAMLNYETVKYFTAEHAVIERYDASLMGYFKMVLSTQLSLALLNFGQALIITAGLTLSMGLAASEVSEGTLSIGELVAINAYILQLYLPLNWLGTSYRMIVNSITDLEKLFDLFDEKSDVEDPTDPVPLVVSSKSSASVEFRNVSFSYPKRGEAEAVPVLNGLSFAVPAGRTVALVGPSGSGKTTIGRLLCRFYDPSEGSILIGDTNIKAVTQRDLRSHIGVVPQDTVLFNETLRYNVEFGSVGCEDGTKLHMTPEQAADEASLGPFVDNLPDGWETVVGERGLRLSGGEKQRVSIARTFVKDPEILILDEATSALDSRSERDIQESLQKVSKGRTTLVIAHRLSTIVDADLIVVLKDGRLAEQGQHHELLARPGSLYAEMWRLQQDQDFAKAEEGSADDMDDRPVTESLL